MLTKHNLNNLKLYPSYHFYVTRKDRVYIHSNEVIQNEDLLIREGTMRYQVTEVIKVKPSIEELITDKENRIGENTMWYELKVKQLN